MKKLSSTNGVIVAMLGVAVLAIAFWMVLLSPKREEADKLGAQVEELQSSLSLHRAEADRAEEARQEFPVTYQQLVVLGKAVPGDDDTASLLVQINRIANRSHLTFRDFTLEAGSTEAAPTPTAAPVGAEGAAAVTPTEAAASTLPLGATIGSAGLGVMPYTLTFDGKFFEIADFIKGLDSLVKTKNANVTVDGRLFTIDGFSLQAAQNSGFPALEATFSVTTYLTPPEQGVTAGATPTGPETAVPVATTTGGAP
jgi:Tfp pilus assembly protein PilO